MGTITDDLERLAGTAPAGSPPPDLWQRGRRRLRRRRAAGLAGAAAVVAVVAASTVGPGLLRTDSPPAADLQDRHLPDRVYVPDRDAPGTDEDGPIGPVAALGAALRNGPAEHPGAMDDPPQEGITYDEHWQLFGVSAVDGTSRWIDLPAGTDPRACDVSPGGAFVACPRVSAPQAGKPALADAILVYDTSEGDTRAIPLPAPEMAYDLGDIPSLRISRDGRFVTTMLTSEPGKNRANLLYAFEIGRDVPPYVRLSQPAKWSPNLASTPTGVAWTDTDEVWTSDGRTSIGVPLEPRLHGLTVSPDGRTALAVRRPVDEDADWQLVTTAWPIEPTSTWKVVAQAPGIDEPLGWIDADRAVVPLGDESWDVVDVRAGKVVGQFGLGAKVQQDMFIEPRYAVGLLGNEIVAGQKPPSYLSDETKTRIALGAFLACGAGAVVFWLRRRRAGA